MVRASGAASTLASAVVNELLLVDNLACLDDPRTFSQLFGRKVAERQRILGLFGGFAAIVLLITALSLTSALAQFVAHTLTNSPFRGDRRQPHPRLGVHRATVGRCAGGGPGLGGVGGMFLARALASQLFGLEPGDLPTMAMALAGLVVLALAASAGPLWHASRVNPARALRAL